MEVNQHRRQHSGPAVPPARRRHRTNARRQDGDEHHRGANPGMPLASRRDDAAPGSPAPRSMPCWRQSVSSAIASAILKRISRARRNNQRGGWPPSRQNDQRARQRRDCANPGIPRTGPRAILRAKICYYARPGCRLAFRRPSRRPDAGAGDVFDGCFGGCSASDANVAIRSVICHCAQTHPAAPDRCHLPSFLSHGFKVVPSRRASPSAHAFDSEQPQSNMQANSSPAANLLPVGPAV